MVEQFQIEEASRRHDLRRQTHILFRRFRIPTGMVVHQRKANAAKVQDRAEQLSNSNARSCCRPHVHLTQSKKAISPIHDCHVQLLVVSSRQEWHRERRKVGGRLHALSRKWPPRRCGSKRSHDAVHAIGITP